MEAVQARLDMVFAKAVNIAISSVNESIIDDCFGDLKQKNKIQSLVINKLAKIEQDFEATYKSLCENNRIPEVLNEYIARRSASSSGVPGSNNSSTSSADVIATTIGELRQAEIDQLNTIIMQLRAQNETLDAEILNIQKEITTEVHDMKAQCALIDTAASLVKVGSNP